MLFYSHYNNQSPNRKVEITLSISDRDNLLWGVGFNQKSWRSERMKRGEPEEQQRIRVIPKDRKPQMPLS